MGTHSPAALRAWPAAIAHQNEPSGLPNSVVHASISGPRLEPGGSSQTPMFVRAKSRAARTRAVTWEAILAGGMGGLGGGPKSADGRPKQRDLHSGFRLRAWDRCYPSFDFWFTTPRIRPR